MATRIQLRRGRAAEWTNVNPVLAAGELGLELDTGKFKFGDGTSSWNTLKYAAGESGDIPTKLSQLTNDTGFITMSDVTAKNYTTMSAVEAKGYLTSEALTDYALKTDIPEKTSELDNDSNFTTLAAVAEQGYAKTNELPTKVSDLENDEGYVKASAVPTKTSQLTNDSNYTTLAAVASEGYTKNVGTVTSVNNVAPTNGNVTLSIPSKTSDLTNDSDFVTATDMSSTYQEKLISGSNIKTINNQSLLGEGNIDIQSGGDATWGSITGTLTDQEDLQAVLDSKHDDFEVGDGITLANNTLRLALHDDNLSDYFTKAGALTITNDRKVSGFGAASFLKSTTNFNVAGGKTWVITVKAKTGNLVGTHSLFGNIGSNWDPLAFRTNGTKLMYQLDSDGTQSGEIGNQPLGTTTLAAQTDYWFKIEFTGTQYKVAFSTDGETYTYEDSMTIDSTKSIATSNLAIGVECGGSSGHVSTTWDGTVYLDTLKIMIDGEPWFDGSWLIKEYPAKASENDYGLVKVGNGISVTDGVISANGATWGNISGTIYEQTDLTNLVGTKLSAANLIQGDNITLTSDGSNIRISATGELAGGVNWGNIGGNLEDQLDLNAVLNEKQTYMEAGDGLTITRASHINLPEGYTALEYTKAEQNAVILTDYTMGTNDEIEADFIVHSITSTSDTGSSYAGGYVLGALGTKATERAYGLGWFTNGNTSTKSFIAGTDDTTWYKGNLPLVVAGTRYKSKLVINGTSQKLYIDGELSLDYTTSNAAPAVPLYLFGRRKINAIGTNTYDTMSGISIYSVSIKRDGTLIKNYVPAKRDSDDKVGMVEAVSGTFLTSATAFDFIGGPEKAGNSDVISLNIDNDTIKVVGDTLVADSGEFKEQNFSFYYQKTAGATGLSDDTKIASTGIHTIPTLYNVKDFEYKVVYPKGLENSDFLLKMRVGTIPTNCTTVLGPFKHGDTIHLDKSYVGFYLMAYDVNDKTMSQSYAQTFCQGVKLQYKVIPEVSTPVATLNSQAMMYLDSFRLFFNGSQVPHSTVKPVIIHGADTHGDSVRVQRMADFADAIGAAEVCLTGDLVPSIAISGYSYLHEIVNNAKTQFVISTGNHDASDTGITNAAQYSRLFAPMASKLGVAANKTWYYHDDTTHKLRFIALDECNEGRAGGHYAYCCQEQATWLVNTLASTPAEYGVFLLYHSPEHVPSTTAEHTGYDKFFATVRPYNARLSGYSGTPYEDVIDAFIGRTTINKTYTQSAAAGYDTSFTLEGDFSSVPASVEFIAHLCGHMHIDGVYYIKNKAHKQLMLDVPCTTGLSGFSAYAGWADLSDFPRHQASSTQDCFNAYVVDRAIKTIHVIRIGANFPYDRNIRDYMSIPYAD